MILWIIVGVLLVSLALNAFQWYRWHAYRSKRYVPGRHSHTGMISLKEIQKHMR